jgi:hypothetical protein
MVQAVDLDELSALWEDNWPNCSKVPYELRSAHDRWVRLHTLPESKRYAETPDEYEIILARHNTVLAELITGPEILLVTTDYSSHQEPEPVRSPQMSAAQPGGAHWVSICTDDEPGFESWLHLYVSRMQWSAACLDPVLRQVADDEMNRPGVSGDSTLLRGWSHGGTSRQAVPGGVAGTGGTPGPGVVW